MSSTVSLEAIVALAKRRGFVFPAAEIYGGLNGVYEMGPLGALLRQHIRSTWIESVSDVQQNDHTYDVVFIEGALLGPQALWKASGHIDHFQDPMIDCTVCKHRYRADDDIDPTKNCPHCGNKSWTDVRQFNMMFQTNVGASTDGSSVAFLRPETAQAIFTNLKNVMTTTRAKIPFGIAQIGKAFRNEITPKQFLFRMREFEQMELEWFCKKQNVDTFFAFWIEKRMQFMKDIGLNQDNVRVREHDKDELSHYSSATSDIEYQFPFGWRELEGIANRGSFDLEMHSKHSGKDLQVYDEETKTSYFPHVIESSIGTDRLMLALLCDAYKEEEIDGEKRTVLSFNERIAPIKGAFLPLSKALAEPMQKIYQSYKRKGISVQFDVSGSIGKRYRRQDEIGTPYCFTYDFESQQDNCVTVRFRDSMKQERISISNIAQYL